MKRTWRFGISFLSVIALISCMVLPFGFTASAKVAKRTFTPIGLETATQEQLDYCEGWGTTATAGASAPYLAPGATSAVKLAFGNMGGGDMIYKMYGKDWNHPLPEFSVIPADVASYDTLEAYVYVPYSECSGGQVPSGLTFQFLDPYANVVASAFSPEFDEWYLNDTSKSCSMYVQLTPADFGLTEFPAAYTMAIAVSGTGPNPDYAGGNVWKPVNVYISGFGFAKYPTEVKEEYGNIGLETATQAQLDYCEGWGTAAVAGASAPYLAPGATSAVKLQFFGAGGDMIYKMYGKDWNHPLPEFSVIPADVASYDTLEAYVYVPYSECSSGQVPSGLTFQFLDPYANVVASAFSPEFDEWYLNDATKSCSMHVQLTPADFGLTEFPAAYTMAIAVSGTGPNPDYAGGNVWKPVNVYISGFRFVKTSVVPLYDYEVTAAATANGTVTADKTVVEDGEVITVTVAPAEGYQLKAGSLKYNGKPLTVRVGRGTDETACGQYQFKMPAADVTVTAEFIPAADTNIAVLGASAGKTADTAGAMRFVSRAARNVGDKHLTACGTYLLRADGALGATLTAGAALSDAQIAALIPAEAGVDTIRKIPTTVLNDRCDEYVEFCLRVNNAANYADAEYIAIAYAEYCDGSVAYSAPIARSYASLG